MHRSPASKCVDCSRVGRESQVDACATEKWAGPGAGGDDGHRRLDRPRRWISPPRRLHALGGGTSTTVRSRSSAPPETGESRLGPDRFVRPQDRPLGLVQERRPFRRSGASATARSPRPPRAVRRTRPRLSRAAAEAAVASPTSSPPTIRRSSVPDSDSSSRHRCQRSPSHPDVEGVVIGETEVPGGPARAAARVAEREALQQEHGAAA